MSYQHSKMNRGDVWHMLLVYRYTDLADLIIKYFGIIYSKNRTLKQRIKEHFGEPGFQGVNWKIEYFEVSTRAEAEAWEAHLISKYETDKYLNVAKSGWGENKYLPDHLVEWIEYHYEKPKTIDKRTRKKQNKNPTTNTKKKKRYDNIGRLLENGEYQKKDGRYEYRYTDYKGNKRSEYSWRLVSEDPMPDGKQMDMCLRDKIKVIKDNEPQNAKMFTLSEWFKKYIKDSDLCDETKSGYYLAFGKHYKSIKNKCVVDITFDDIYKCLKKTAQRDHPSLGTLRNICSILSGAFQYGIQNGILDNNPTNCVIDELKFNGVI